jgi:hypothetical protein
VSDGKSESGSVRSEAGMSVGAEQDRGVGRGKVVVADVEELVVGCWARTRDGDGRKWNERAEKKRRSCS